MLIRRLLESECGAAAVVAAAAFAADPLLDRFLHSGWQREQLFRAAITPLETRRCVAVCAEANGRVDAVAMWTPPKRGDSRRLPPSARLREAAFRAYSVARGVRWSALPAAVRFGRAIAAFEPPRPHVYLSMIAVHPRARGAGAGQALLQPMIQHADTEGLPCFLECSNPAALPFYERLGFRALAEVEFAPGTGVFVTPMLRAPAGSSDEQTCLHYSARLGSHCARARGRR